MNSIQLTCISSGASVWLSLKATGCTSSTLMAGRLLTISTSGIAYIRTQHVTSTGTYERFYAIYVLLRPCTCTAAMHCDSQVSAHSENWTARLISQIVTSSFSVFRRARDRPPPLHAPETATAYSMSDVIKVISLNISVAIKAHWQLPSIGQLNLSLFLLQVLLP